MRIKVKSAACVAAAIVALLSACSSKNQDSLIGTNVDENLAMMDANASSEPNMAATNVAHTARPPADTANDRSVQPSGAAAASSNSRGSGADQERPEEMNALGSETHNAPAQDEGAVAIGNEQDAPNSN